MLDEHLKYCRFGPESQSPDNLSEPAALGLSYPKLGAAVKTVRESHSVQRLVTRSNVRVAEARMGAQAVAGGQQTHAWRRLTTNATVARCNTTHSYATEVCF